MNRLHFSTLTLLVAAPAMLAGCGQTLNPATGMQPIGPGVSTSLQSRPVANRSKSYIYVADYTGSAVDVYPALGKNPDPITVIKDGINGPYGIAIDSKGALYVANADAATVTEYPAGATSPSVTLRDGLVSPTFTAVDSAGNVWVSNTGLPGNVVEYHPNDSAPALTLTNGITDPTGLAFGAGGTLFVAINNGTGQSSILVFPKGATKPSKSFGAGTLINPQGISLDKNGNVYVSDFYNAEIYVFDHKSYKLTRTVPSCPSCGIDSPVATTIAANNRVYVSLGETSEVYEFAKLGRTWPPLPAIIEKGLNSAWGIAADPPVFP